MFKVCSNRNPFRCNDGSNCIDRMKVCDGVKDCLNGHDELKDLNGNCVKESQPFFKIIDKMANNSGIETLLDFEEQNTMTSKNLEFNEDIQNSFTEHSQILENIQDAWESEEYLIPNFKPIYGAEQNFEKLPQVQGKAKSKLEVIQKLGIVIGIQIYVKINHKSLKPLFVLTLSFSEPCFVLGGCHKFPVDCNRDLGECDLDSNLTRKGNAMDSKEVTLELKIKISNREYVKPNWMGIYIDGQENQMNEKYGVVFIASAAFPKSVGFLYF